MNSAGSLGRIDAARWQRRSLVMGIVAFIVCAIGVAFSPASFLRAYLVAYLFFLGIALGSMVMLMLYHLTGGSWGLLIRRILEAAMKTLPLLVLGFLPIAFGLRYLYPWAQPDVVVRSPKLQYQQFYLNPAGFWIRAVVYFAVWLITAYLLSSWSRREDQTGNPRFARKSFKLSGYGALAYGISLHFAAIDWGMSLEPVFHSTIWGPLFAVGQLLSALAFALIVLALVVDRPPLAEVASLKARNDQGSLLLSLLILWAYMAWCQFMLVWIANMPVDVIWYLPRASTAWKAVMWVIVIFHFVIPFFCLLMRPLKRNSKSLAWTAALILLMQLVFMYYQVMPGLPDGWGLQLWAGIVAPLGVGGLWLAWFLWQLGRQPLLPLYDRNRAAALHLRHLDEEEAARKEALAYG